MHPLLEKYVQAVLAAPLSLHLTSAHDAGEFLERHVLDALKLVDTLPQHLHPKGLKVIDVGSGNGIPGLPIAIALPTWELFLLDSNNKKCGFIDMFCKFNQIKNVHVVPARAEVLAHDESYRQQFNLAFARALGKLPTALELASPFLKREATLVIPHGRTYASELERSKKAMKELGIAHQKSTPYAINKEVSFTALTFLKVADTPEKYPRKTGIPEKRPL